MTTLASPARGSLANFARDHVTYGIFALITLYFIAFAPHFASLATATAVLRITAIVSVMAIGMTFVIVSGEIDLSVGSVASFAGMAAAMLYDRGASTCKRRSNNPSLKRPDFPVAPEQKSGSRYAFALGRRRVGDEGRGALWARSLRGSDRGVEPSRGGATVWN